MDYQKVALLRHFLFSFDGYPLWQAITRPTEVQLTQVLFLQLENSQLMILGIGSASKVHSKPELCVFENVVTKSVTFASILRQIWRLPSLNGHSSACRGAIDPGPFSTARGFPADDFRHWKCLKSPFQAWLIRVQSSDTKGEFWAIFGRTPSFYWFSLFLLPLSRFWPISFEPPLKNPRLRPDFLGGLKYNVFFKETSPLLGHFCKKKFFCPPQKQKGKNTCKIFFRKWQNKHFTQYKRLGDVFGFWF